MDWLKSIFTLRDEEIEDCYGEVIFSLIYLALLKVSFILRMLSSTCDSKDMSLATFYL